MLKLALYCKTYPTDFLRAKRLLVSIQKFNIDEIPVFLSTAADDYPLLRDVVGTDGYQWVSDESIIQTNPNTNIELVASTSPYVAQGIIKAEFWRLGLAENYLCIDSDSEFIKPFHASDFISPLGEPYTVIHQNKELWQTAYNRKKDKVVDAFHRELEAMRAYFPREGPAYCFMPSPFLWSSKVWRSLDEQMLAPKGLTLWDVVERGLGEYHWYGEALLAYQAIPMLPVEPYFRVYHYDWQFFQLRNQGEKRSTVAKNYLGIITQSNWQSELDYGKPNKSILSRIARSLRRCSQSIRSRF